MEIAQRDRANTGTTSLTGTVTITLPYIGTNNIVANYLGDTNFGDSSNTTSFLVNPAVTTTMIWPHR